MILEFKFRNFRSAKDWQILSFEASADKISEEYYCTTINDTKVLKLGILYGANASGKTNVLLALDFIRKIAISPKINKMQPIGFTPFLLDDTTKKECGVFELTFFVNNMKHLYYLEVDNSAVLKETLKYYPGKQPAEIFSRETINGITHIRLGSKVKLNVAEQEKLQVNTLSNMSVVSAYATANFMFPELERVYNYFLKQWLPILLPQTDLKTWTTGEMEAEKENKSFLLDLLHRADFNISGFDVQQNEKNKKDTDLIFEHTIVANGTSSVHYLPDILESAGTMRYYGLGTILNILLERNAIIPVDELENSLHPDLFAHFINLFLVNSTYSQLIFSTHNLQSLDTEDLLRADAPRTLRGRGRDDARRPPCLQSPRHERPRGASGEASGRGNCYHREGCRQDDQPGENPRPGPQQPVLFTDKYFIHRGFGNGFSAKIRRRC